jgi:hypothetical protein
MNANHLSDQRIIVKKEEIPLHIEDENIDRIVVSSF